MLAELENAVHMEWRRCCCDDKDKGLSQFGKTKSTVDASITLPVLLSAHKASKGKRRQRIDSFITSAKDQPVNHFKLASSYY